MSAPRILVITFFQLRSKRAKEQLREAEQKQETIIS